MELGRIGESLPISAFLIPYVNYIIIRAKQNLYICSIYIELNIILNH